MQKCRHLPCDDRGKAWAPAMPRPCAHATTPTCPLALRRALAPPCLSPGSLSPPHSPSFLLREASPKPSSRPPLAAGNRAHLCKFRLNQKERLGLVPHRAKGIWRRLRGWGDRGPFLRRWPSSPSTLAAASLRLRARRLLARVEGNPLSLPDIIMPPLASSFIGAVVAVRHRRGSSSPTSFPAARRRVFMSTR